MAMPRVIIAGAGSGCGKTTLTMGLLALLRRQGLKVQPYKVGPDYIDPMFHQYATGRPSINLDSWMLTEDVLRHLFVKNFGEADLAVIEGVMGLFDGQGGYSLAGSTAHVSQILRAPIVLVASAAGMGLSISALLRGYQQFVPDLSLKGVILNQVKSKSHFMLLKQIIEEQNGLKVIGYLPKLEELALPSRHLGLVAQNEISGLNAKMERLQQELAQSIDLETLKSLASDVDTVKSDIRAISRLSGPAGPVKLAVAKDAAFTFYYHDNLDLLEQLGAKLVFFSPLAAGSLPEGISGLYLGGGYPELFAAELSANHSMRESIRRAAGAGMPVYAECGGMMYLCRTLADQQGKVHEMCGVFSVDSQMTDSLQHFGYVELMMNQASLFGPAGLKVRAHEFHYSRLDTMEELPGVYRVSKQQWGGRQASWSGGLTCKNVLAGYPHLHFWANPRLAENFILRCREYGKGMTGL
jgi:cobyrinic acid a,c-diamide synthase